MTLTNRSWKFTLVTGVVAMMAGSALAAPVSFNFVGRDGVGDTTGFPLDSDQVAGFDSVADDNWNNSIAGNDDTQNNLKDGDGVETQIDITHDANGNWSTFIGGTSGNVQMMRGRNKDQKDDDTFTITFTEVPDGQWDLYVYTTSDDGANRYSSYSITTGTTTGASAYFVEPQEAGSFNGSGGSNWMRGTNTTNTTAAMDSAGVANYILFEGITPDAGTITLSIDGLESQLQDNGGDYTSVRAHVSGVQLVPEPASLALMGLGGLCLLGRRRK